MQTSKARFQRTLLGLAVLAALAPVAHGQDTDDVAGLKRPDSAISAGAGLVTGSEADRSIFGQYNGLREHRGNLLLDFDYTNRNDQTGFWTIFRGRNLGLEIPEVGFTLQKQGDWRLSADYNQIVHHEIRTINTGMVNPGSTTPGVVLIAPGTGSDVNLELKRKAIGLSGEKWFTSRFQFEATFKNEDKDGARLWGRGYDCASYVCATTQNATSQRWAVLMLPEPVNYNTKQIDAKLNYTHEKLFLTAGYYGSFFTNSNGNLSPSVPNQLYGPTGLVSTLNPAAPGGTSLQSVLQLPMALQPDNQAHQFYVSGNYAWTPKSHSTFKLAYTHATQNEDFSANGFTGLPNVSRGDLGGEINTMLAQFGLTMRPTSKLNLLGNVRYERKDDKTPIARYNIEDTTIWPNSHISSRKFSGKLEAGYRLPANIRGTVGIDYEEITRELPPLEVDIAGLSALRERTDEITYRGELRRSISETLTGAIGLSHAERKGSDWYNLCVNAGCTAAGLVYGGSYSDSQIFQRTGIFPYMLANRDSDSLKLSADWLATERVSVQLVAQATSDAYHPPSEKGLRDGRTTLLSIDGAYTLSERWKFLAYASIGNQELSVAHSTAYFADIKNQTTAFGINLAGKPTGVLELGAGLSYARDKTQYGLSPDALSSGTNVQQIATYGLPDVSFTETRLGLYAKYAVNKQSDIRLDLARIDAKLDEWAWGYNGVPFVYSDGTTVGLKPHQQVTFATARFIYKF